MYVYTFILNVFSLLFSSKFKLKRFNYLKVSFAEEGLYVTLIIFNSILRSNISPYNSNNIPLLFNILAEVGLS